MFSLTRFLDVGKESRGLLLRCYFCFLCSGMMCTLIGALLPAVRAEYGISYALAGVLTSAHQTGNILAVLAAGFLPYMIGRKRSSVAMGSGNFLGLLLLTATGGRLPLLAAYTLTGAGRGTMSNITNVVVGQRAGNKAGALNLLHAVFAVGATISPFIAIAAGDSLWRLPCWVVAFFCLLSLVLLWASPLEDTKEARPAEGSLLPRTADFWRVTLILFCYISAESCLMNWLVTFVKDTGIIKGIFALSVQSLMWIMIMSGRLLCAWLSSRVDRNVLVLVLASVAAGFFILLTHTQSKVLTIVSVLGVGLSMGGIYPTTLSTMPERYARSTSATGICMSVACVGGVVMPLLVGLAADRTGDIRSGFVLVLGAFALLLGVIVWKIAAERKGRASRLS